MRDPVAEILAERSATRSGLAGAIAFSIVLHAAGAALAVATALRQTPPRPVSTLNIKFAPMPAVSASATPAVPKPTPPTPVLPRIQEPAPAPVKAPPEKAAEPPAKNTVPLSPFGKSSKKGADVPAPPPQPPRTATPEATSTAGGAIPGDIGIGETGVSGLEGGDFPYTLYLDNMKRLIGTRWVRPPITAGATTVVYFRIQRDGTIRDAATVTTSGNTRFDLAALRAVIEASPLPSLPFAYSGNYLGVHLTFR
ncbi:MAG TPA: energy transducer TonB [Thermoanaerobaculia bacterium]|nr:energy transducer TonB [Thermoanaerobaculia bacterium]